jgi:hypothetical protein
VPGETQAKFEGEEATEMNKLDLLFRVAPVVIAFFVAVLVMSLCPPAPIVIFVHQGGNVSVSVPWGGFRA